MRRGVVLAVVVAVALIVGWRMCDRSDRAAPGRSAKPLNVKRVDPAKLVRGSIAGIVIDEAKAPIAGAFVCTDDHAVTCARSDARGSFVLDGLTGRHDVHASARSYRPATVRGVVGESVEIVLRRGGVEVTGTVSDLTGGPIANARVWSIDAVTESGVDGSFSLWVPPGDTEILASSAGYADTYDRTQAPKRIELVMTPESVITGIVIDASTKKPIEGARVSGGAEGAVTDAQGRFRCARLAAGRYSFEATTEHGYGRSQGSTAVDVGGEVDGVVIEMYPAAKVVGRVIVSSTKAPCSPASVSIRDAAKDRARGLHDEGSGVVGHGILPGAYTVDVRCNGHVGRDNYPVLVVGTADVEATWEVDPGGRIEGTVTNRAGVAIDGRRIVVRPDYHSATTNAEGRYTIEGARPGKVRVSADANDYSEVTVEVSPNATSRRDIVVEDTGSIRGTVRDDAGKPVRLALVRARWLGDDYRPGDGDTTDQNGEFVIPGLALGDYELTASRRHALDVASTALRVHVQANKVASASLVLADRTGAIAGTVVDAAGRPVSDAFIHVANERTPSNWEALRDGWGQPKTITSLDGRFIVSELPPGNYAVRAFRSTGSDAVVEGVGVGTSVKLTLRPTGSIAGVVRSWGSTLDELSIVVRDERVRYQRSERFYRTNGAFEIDNLPAGRFTIAAGAEGREIQVAVDLTEGQHKRGLEIVLVPLVTITGRTVDHLTKQPVGGVRVYPHVAGASTRFSRFEIKPSAENGRFTTSGVPVGKITLVTSGRHTTETYATRTITGTGVIDIGDVLAVRSHASPNGASGIEFREVDFSAPLETAQLIVEKVAVNSPGARAGIKIGDVITSIDGIDTTGYGAVSGWSLVDAPAGTKLSFTLARGVTVDVVLAKQ